MVNSLVEHVSRLIEEESASDERLPIKRLGFLGRGKVFSSPNMRIKVDTLGLSSGSCCIHKRLTWMQRNTSDRVHESLKHSSISS